MSVVETNIRPSPRRGPLRFGTFQRDPDHLRGLERVRRWTREHLELTADDTVMVSEVACNRPGCPPLETVVAFWSDGGERYPLRHPERHMFKVFKAAADVVPDDLPPAWLKDALYATDDPDWGCC